MQVKKSAAVPKPIDKMTLGEIAGELYERSWVMAKAPKGKSQGSGSNVYPQDLLTPHVWRAGRWIKVRYGNEIAEPLIKGEARQYLR